MEAGGKRGGVCRQVQEGKNRISCVDTSTDFFLLHKDTRTSSVTHTHTHALFFSVTPTHNRLLKFTSSYLQGPGLARRGHNYYSKWMQMRKGSNMAEFDFSLS